MNRTYTRAVRVVAIFFMSYLQHQYPELVWFLCSLVKQGDYESTDWGYSAPIREEALIALSYSPTPQVWEALVEGYFYNRTSFLDWIYPQTIRGVTAALEMGRSLYAIKRSEPFPYHSLNSETFHALANLEIDLPEQC